MDKTTVLLVDDDPGFLDSCSQLLSPEFDVEITKDGKQAISILKDAEGTFEVAVIDMLMYNDEDAGLKLIQQIGQMPILVRPASIVLTANGSINNASKCMEEGARSYVAKGKADTPELLRQSIKRAAEFKRSLSLTKSFEIIADIIEKRDPFENRHSKRITNWSLAVLSGMDKSTPQKKQDLEITSRLHNVGKLRLPEHISDKPGIKTPKERKLFLAHPQLGMELINTINSINIITQEVLGGILHHHERWDGSGYPHGLKKNGIPFLSRIIAVACEYDHAFSSSNNRALRNPKEAKQTIIKLKKKGKLDPDVVDAFIAALDKGDITKDETERFADVRFTDARRQIELRQYDQAKKSCDEAIEAMDDEEEYFLSALNVAAGDLFLNAGDDTLYKIAAEYFTQAIKLRPVYAEAYYKRGLAYQKQSMWEQADAQYAVATAIVPSYLEALIARGEVRYSGNFFDDAYVSFDRVLSLIGKGKDADVSQLKYLKAQSYLGIGRVQARKGKKPQALNSYNSALDLCEDKELKKRIEHQKEIL